MCVPVAESKINRKVTEEQSCPASTRVRKNLQHSLETLRNLSAEVLDLDQFLVVSILLLTLHDCFLKVASYGGLAVNRRFRRKPRHPRLNHRRMVQRFAHGTKNSFSMSRFSRKRKPTDRLLGRENGVNCDWCGHPQQCPLPSQTEEITEVFGRLEPCLGKIRYRHVCQLSTVDQL